MDHERCADVSERETMMQCALIPLSVGVSRGSTFGNPKCRKTATLYNKEGRLVSIYKRGKSWYYDFQSRGERYTGCIGVVSKTVAKEVLAKKKAEATEGLVWLPE